MSSEASTGSDSQSARDSGVPGSTLGRSIGAVGVGCAVGILLTLGTDAALHGAGVLPNSGQIPATGALLLATVYRCIYGIIGSYVIAVMAPNRPMGHALVGGFLGVVANTVGTIATWNKGPEFAAHWYPIALILTAMPCAWLGGKWRISQLAD